MNPRVTLQIDDGIATVMLNRPDKLNGVDVPMLRALVETARALRRDRSVRVVILRGAGPAFSAGLDFASVLKDRRAQIMAFLTFGVVKANLFQKACAAWRELPAPVLAVLHGRCYGAAFQLALAADFRFAAPDCELSIMEGKWGLIPDMSATLTLRELASADLIKRLAMTAEIFSARQAYGWGLVSETAADPLAAALQLAERLRIRSPDALAATKKLFRSSWTAGERRALALERRLQLRLLLGRNARIAIQAGLGKTQPDYERRMRW